MKRMKIPVQVFFSICIPTVWYLLLNYLAFLGTTFVDSLSFIYSTALICFIAGKQLNSVSHISIAISTLF